METKKIKMMMTFDRDLWQNLTQFVEFLDPVLTWNRKKYKLEMGKLLSRPIPCGVDIGDEADLIVDRAAHWNRYAKALAQSAMNSGIPTINNSETNSNFDKHSTCDLLIRAMHPEDRHPVTVLLPEFRPYTPDQVAQDRWLNEQRLILENTKFGFDPERRVTDWTEVRSKQERSIKFEDKFSRMRQEFFVGGNYLAETVEKYFGGKFPLYLKKAFGGGGSDVFKINSIEELYEKYDSSEGKVFHLQESVECYDEFIRCMGIGPQVLPMRFCPDKPLHEHYSEAKIRMEPKVYERMKNYVLFINSFHRWTYNSFEALVKQGVIMPIDYANACPDSYLTSLHVHYPWLMCALVRWMSFVVVTDHNMRMDTEQEEYFKVLRDPKISQLKKYEFCAKKSVDYFQVEKFEEFCDKNWKGLEEKMVEFYDRNVDDLISRAISWSDFPEEEHQQFFWRYKEMMETLFRKNPEEYLKTVIYTEPEVAQARK